MIKRTLASVLIFIFYFATNTLSANNREIIINPAGDWISPQSIKLPSNLPHDLIEGGTYYALVDHQIKVEEDKPSQYYSHYGELIVNQQGLEEASQINVEFDPIYESVIFHKLNVIRNKQIIDKLETAKLSILQRETELNELIFDGLLTANFILDDIRIGDIIEYSYTITGENPVYQGIFSYQKNIQWSVPVHQQSIRLLWGKQNPLFVSKLNTEQEINTAQNGKFIEFSTTVFDQKPLILNNEKPDWYRPYARLFFSETKDWKDVVTWSLPLYQNAVQVSTDVKAIADKIADDFSDPEKRVTEALKFVQTEIRYFGIELGVNSHLPSTASETLKRRYGDCKDKTVLFISLLKQLGIEASPALVNTRLTQLLIDYPPIINAFNHVMVKVNLNDKVFWLDPTRQYQYGNLSHIYQPDYHSALVLDDDVNNLQRMHDNPDTSWTIIEDSFDLTNGVGNSVNFKTNTEYTGLAAEKQFSYITEYGLNSTQKDFIEFYQDYYGEIITNEKISIKKNTDTGIVSISEDYQLNDLWDKNLENKKFYAYFYANSIDPYLPKPKQEIRNSPYSINYPKNVRQTIKIILPAEEWSFEDEEAIEDNPFFYFKFISEYNKRTRILTLNYQLNLHTNHINVKDIDDYLLARERVTDETEYGIQKPFLVQEGSDNELDIHNWILLIYISLLTLGLAFAIINWRIESRKTSTYTEAAFYPVSLVKLTILSIATFGIFGAYWFYRNWLFVKNKEKNNSMPIARAIFSQFWYYPLYLRLTNDSTERSQQNKVLAKPLAIVFAIVFLSLYFLTNIEYALLPMLIIEVLLLFPLANYINHIEQQNDSALVFNSRWLARHNVVVLIFLPLLIFIYGSTINLLPNDKIVRGHQLWNHDIKFMQRKKLFPANEKILYFYSDALLTLRNDGNGFTPNHVFSYWKDENNQFQSEYANFKQVKDLKFSTAKNWRDMNSVIITRKDDSSFTLYLSSTHKEGNRKFIKALKQQLEITKQ